MMRSDVLAMAQYLAEQPVVDCHEHTLLPDQLASRTGVGDLLADSDIGDDLISSGMPAADRTALTFEAAAPWLDRVRNTGFARSIAIALAELFGFDGDLSSRSDWDAASAALDAANSRADWYDDVLSRRGRIETVLRIQGDEADPYDIPRDRFAPIIRFDEWIVADASGRDALAASLGEGASTLDAYVVAMEAAFADAVRRGAVGAKSMLAYRRSLAHGRPTRSAAGAAFDRGSSDAAAALTLQDYLVHQAAELAGRYGLPYQVHVGMGSWQREVAASANPLLLGPLIEAHRGTTFVLLHGGYPFIDEMGSLAKTHPNVVLECGWLAYISPSTYRRAMVEWLDAVPANKLLAFGADCARVEQTLGALRLTQRQLALALTDKVVDSGWSLALAQSVARRVLADNARELYRLPREEVSNQRTVTERDSAPSSAQPTRPLA